MDSRISSIEHNINSGANYINSKTPENLRRIDIAIILGSGLGGIADLIENSIEINYSDIPGYPLSTVPGHEGKLIIGKINDKNILAAKGRFHYYEGYELNQVIHPVRVIKKLNVKNLLVTNAAGAVNTDYTPGSLMLINDHINLSGINPLRGCNLETFGHRFPDMTFAYSSELRMMAMNIANMLNIKLYEGVYAYMPGPSYETPAEIRALRTLGADAVGMSTVPEVITAVHSGMNVMGISCLCNMAAGILDKPLCHTDVLEAADKAKKDFIKLVLNIITQWPNNG